MALNVTAKQLEFLVHLLDERDVSLEDAEFFGNMLEAGLTRAVASDFIDIFLKLPKRKELSGK